MKKYTTIYKAEGTFIIDFPASEPQKVESILVQQPRELFIAITDGPRFLQVKQLHWVDPEGYKKESDIKYCQSMENMYLMLILENQVYM